MEKTKKKGGKDEFKIDDTERYKKMLAELDEIERRLAELRKRSEQDRIEIIKERHKEGYLILIDKRYGDFYARGNFKFLKKLARDLKAGLSTLYHAIRFVRKHPDIENFLRTEKILEDKKKNWTYIKEFMLTEKVIEKGDDLGEYKPRITLTLNIDKELNEIYQKIQSKRKPIIHRNWPKNKRELTLDCIRKGIKHWRKKLA